MFPLRASLCLLLLSGAAVKDRYDVVHGGRVMDPETGLGAVRDVGVLASDFPAPVP